MNQVHGYLLYSENAKSQNNIAYIDMRIFKEGYGTPDDIDVMIAVAVMYSHTI